MNGNYSIVLKNFILYTFIICLSLYLTINSNLLYFLTLKIHNLDMSYFHLYKQVIDYINNPNDFYLKIDNFRLSNDVIIHFREVKNLNEYNNIILLLSGFFSLYFYFFNWTLIITPLNLILKYKIIFISFVTFVIVDFKELFYVFHVVIFKNNYWIIDASKDPIINIFPDYYFKYSFILAIIYFLIIVFMFFQLKKRS